MTSPNLRALRSRALNGLTESLTFFSTYARDPAGGFYGAVSRDLAPDPHANRSLVLTARLLWTYASAYRVLRDPAHLALALHAYDALKTRFIDPEHGGGYWGLYPDGTIQDDRKLVYGQAFILYGCSELSRALEGDAAREALRREALDTALSVYRLLETHARDGIHGGYYESYSRQWERRMESFNIPDPSLGSKALNTHLHVIEAYTNLYRAWRDGELHARLGELIEIMSHKLLDREIYHYKPYMTDDWRTTKALVSFGHDIEGAWLLTEAAEVYGDDARIEASKAVSLRIADACHDGGVDPVTGGMWYEHHIETGEYERDLSWWVQAEAVVGFWNAYEISGDARYLGYALESWDFIDRCVVDREGGVYREWRACAGLPLDHPRNRFPVNAWKTPYHNGRMYLELIERIDRALGE